MHACPPAHAHTPRAMQARMRTRRIPLPHSPMRTDNALVLCVSQPHALEQLPCELSPSCAALTLAVSVAAIRVVRLAAPAPLGCRYRRWRWPIEARGGSGAAGSGAAGGCSGEGGNSGRKGVRTDMQVQTGQTQDIPGGGCMAVSHAI
jgi:hypothetical protein